MSCPGNQWKLGFFFPLAVLVGNTLSWALTPGFGACGYYRCSLFLKAPEAWTGSSRLWRDCFAMVHLAQQQREMFYLKFTQTTLLVAWVFYPYQDSWPSLVPFQGNRVVTALVQLQTETMEKDAGLDDLIDIHSNMLVWGLRCIFYIHQGVYSIMVKHKASHQIVRG